MKGKLMFKIVLSTLFILSLGFADGKKERSVVKKKVVMIASDDNQESKNINVEANVDGEILKLVITVNGDKKEFEVPMGNKEAMESLERELEEMDLDINIAQFMNHDGNSHDDDHDFRRMMHWRGNETGGGYLGVQIQGLDGQLADYFGAKNGGVLVTEVIEDSPAEKSGMKTGDVIVSVAGEDVGNPSDLVEEIRGHNPDSKVELNIIRKNRKRKMKVTLGEAPQTFGMGFGPGQNQMFFGNGRGFDDEDVDIFFNMDHGNPHKIMKKFRFHDDDDENDLEEEMDEFRKELKELKAELKKLKQDS
jgi:membrane-associated protease RseP (regulator of RpoE activity)